MVFLPNIAQLRGGDILLTFNAESEDRKGTKQSQWIATVTGGRFSHALICSTPPTFVEAIGTGVSSLSLGRCFTHDIANVRVLRYPDFDIARRAADLARLEVGRDYSIARAIKSAFPSRTLSKIEDHGIFCSALVAQVYANAGSALFQQTSVDRTTPATIDALEGLEDMTSTVFRKGLAPSNIETMSALDGDRAPSLSARLTTLSSDCAKELFRTADQLAKTFPEVGLDVTPTFYGLLDFVVKAVERTADVSGERRPEFLVSLSEIDKALAAFVERGEMTALLREVAMEDDGTMQRNLVESFQSDPDIDIDAMKNYLVTSRTQLSQREAAIKNWQEWGLERSAAMRAYLPIDQIGAEATRLRISALEEILGRLG